MTREEIINILKEKDVPVSAVFCDAAGGKYLAWGGIQILEAVIGEGVIDWHKEEFDMPSCNVWSKLLDWVKKNEHIQLIHYNTSSGMISVYGDEEFKNMISLCGGFNNYVKTIGE